MKIKYPRVMISVDGSMEEEMIHRLHERRKIGVTLGNLWKEKTTSREIKTALYGTGDSNNSVYVLNVFIKCSGEKNI